MSSGHHHHPLPEVSEREVDKILADPMIRAYLARKPTINFAYDIPYLAGYSEDGNTIYVDRHLPARDLPVPAGRTVNVLPFLIVHEHTEKAIIDVLHRHYQFAHAVASKAENRAVREAGYLPGPYNQWLDPYIKSDEHERLKKVPKDLDLTPYIDSHDIPLLNHLRTQMNRER